MTEETSRVAATVTRVWNETPTLTGVELAVEESVAAKYTRPGQYIVLHPTEGKPVFIALASAPGAASFELLLGEGAASTLAPTQGGQIDIDPPAGKGYPIDDARGKDLMLFSMGSGASAIRSVVEYVRAHRSDFGSVTMFHGAHTPEEHAYRALSGQWAADRIDIIRAVSKPWVQDIFRSRQPSVENTIAFVCGTKDMVASVTEALGDAGLSAELVRQNF